ncbi:hypothetical protein MMC16_001409 [Acarospora aff. strigata]|nr:hypothetical protein [Acarospora aff. strigata]
MRSPTELPSTGFASANSTLNTFLGGQQKPWMTTEQHIGSIPAIAAPPERRRKRVAKSTTTDSNPLSSRTTVFNRDIESGRQYSLQQSPGRTFSDQPPSNSTSPILANTVNQRKETSGPSAGSRNIFMDNVLPSPTPSDDVHPDISSNTVNSENELHPEARRLTELAARYGGVDELERHLFSTPRSGSLPSGGPPLTVRPNGIYIPDSGVSVAAHQYSPRKRSLGIAQPKNKRAKLPTPNDRPLQIPQQNQMNMPSCEHNTPVTEVAQTAQGASLKQYIPTLNEYVVAVGGVPGPERSMTLPRIRLLKDACNLEDCFYLVLHQLYCLYSVEPQTVMQLPYFGHELMQSFDTVARLLLQNSMLPDQATKWFGSFPAPVHYLLQYSSLYRAAYNNVKDFLMKFPGHWQMLQVRCKQRMYPPLVDELVYELGLESRVFQHVVFRAVHRGIWGAEPSQSFQKAEELFRRNRLDNLQKRHWINCGNSPTVAEMQDANERLANEYQKLYVEHRREVQARSANLVTIPTSIRTGLEARPPTQRASFSSVHEAGFVSPGVTRRGSQDRPEARRTQSVTTVLPTQTQQLRPGPTYPTTGHQPIHSPSPLGSSSAVAPPIVYNQANMHRFTTPQTQQAQAEPIRNQQQQLAQPNLDGMNPVSMDNASVPSSALLGQCQAYSSFQPGLETLPPGGHRSSRVSHRHAMPMSSDGAMYVTSSPVQTAPLAGQLLIPPLNHVPSFSSCPNPTLSALHQANLRSPTMKAVDGHTEKVSTTTLYQHVAKFALTPQSIHSGKLNYVWPFHVSKIDFNNIAIDTQGPYGAPPTRKVRSGSEMYRIRCTKLPSSKAYDLENDWAITDTFWPRTLIIDINGVHLSIRRKHHHGKDLPIDVTPHIKEGGNEVKVGLMISGKRDESVQYAIAVEVVRVVDHKNALDCATAVPAHEVLESIKESLTSNTGDDDLTVVDNTITISLIDAFSARIFHTPVRGVACLHRECFDHETFFQAHKPKQLGSLTKVDGWKCPICGADARPHKLIVDCFLADVRDELARQSLLDTKFIVVKEDGSWRPKVENSDERDDDQSQRSSSTRAHVTAAPGGDMLLTPRRESVVIELDDD